MKPKIWIRSSKIRDFIVRDLLIVLICGIENRIEITQYHPRTNREPSVQICPQGSPGNNSIEAINKSCHEAGLRDETGDTNMKTLSRRINEINQNCRRILEENYSGIGGSPYIWKTFKCLSRNQCMKATLGEDILVSSRPHTSILCFFIRWTTSCCFRGLLSPLTFQLSTNIGM
jgi:hypothetical protein